MGYLSIFLGGAIAGMLVDMFLYNYFSRNTKSGENKNLATKDDISKITTELDEIFEAEKKFYESIAGEE